MKLYALAIALVALSLFGMQAYAKGVIITPSTPTAYSPQFYAFLGTYMSHSAINTSTYHNESIGNDTYVIMRLSGNPNYFIINTTNGHYSFVIGNATAYSVLRPFALVRFYPSNSTLSKLRSYMVSYQQTAASSSLSDCLTETGLSTGLTCTLANGCASCQVVPVCRKFLAATNTYNASTSPTTPTVASNLAVTSISNFSAAYNNLNSSYNSYFSALSGINYNDSYQALLLLKNITQRISNISTYLPRNPIFPVPAGFSPSNFSTCTTYVTSKAPWYCNSVGYCRSVTFNSTTLYSIQTMLTNLLQSPLSNQSIKALSDNATAQAFSFLRPGLQASFSAIIAANYGRYNATTANATALLSVYRNASLANAIAALQGTFSNLVGYNFRINASTYNSSLSSEFSNLSIAYIPLAAEYAKLKAISTNNTALVLQRELEYKSEPAALASLAYSQQSVNDLLASGINSSQYASVYAQLTSIKAGLDAIGAPISMPAVIKGIDGGLVSSILAGSNAPVPSKLAVAPLYVFLITLAIAILAIIVIYFATYHHLKRRQRLHLHKAAKRAWILLFAVLFVIAIAFSYLTSAYAAQANAFLPIDGFAAQLATHHSVVIAYNGTAAAANTSIQQCTAAMNRTLTSINRTVRTLTMQNYTCTGSQNPSCFDQLLASGTPVIVVSQSPVSYVTYKGMYGQTLYAGGEAVSGNQCYLNGILKVK